MNPTTKYVFLFVFGLIFGLIINCGVITDKLNTLGEHLNNHNFRLRRLEAAQPFQTPTNHTDMLNVPAYK